MNNLKFQTGAGTSSSHRAPFDDPGNVSKAPCPLSAVRLLSNGSQKDGPRSQANEPVKSGSNDGATEDAPARMAADGVARRSLSSRFKVNAQTGGVGCTLPIETSPGRSNFGPELSLQYGSGSAGTNGVFGAGWSLDGVAHIGRKTALAIPMYDDGDTFVHSSLGDLVPVEQADVAIDGHRVREYRARVEAEPMCIQRWKKDGETFWKTISSTNIVTIYGRGDNDQVFHRTNPTPSKRILSWLQSEAYDCHGNAMKYSYKAEDCGGIQQGEDVFEAHRSDPSPQRYLKSIQYGNTTPNRDLNQWDVVVPVKNWLFEVVFAGSFVLTHSPSTAVASRSARTGDVVVF